MNQSKVLLAGLIGLLLGVAASHISVPIAKAQEPGAVHVYIWQETVSNSNDRPSLNIPGGKVVGFTCISKPASVTLPNKAICYIATSP